MKKILVPTDFSLVADNALEYAIEITAHFKSEIHLYHIYSFDRFNYDLNLPKEKQPYPKELERSMRGTKLKFIKKITEKGLSIRTFVEEDSLFSLFKTKVIAYGIDMIVMGSKGASGMTKVFFGSVAATALDMAKVPVLVVPPKHTFHPIGHIVLAIDQNRIAPEVLSPLMQLALTFGAKVTLLSIGTNSKKKTGPVLYPNFDIVETVFREVPMYKNINETIDRFVQEEACELLCMVRREKGILRSLLHRSVTKTQVYRNLVPLLVLPEV